MKVRSLLASKQLRVSVITLILIIFVFLAINQTIIHITSKTLINEHSQNLSIQQYNKDTGIVFSIIDEKYVLYLIGHNLRYGPLYTKTVLAPNSEILNNEFIPTDKNNEIEDIELEIREYGSKQGVTYESEINDKPMFKSHIPLEHNFSVVISTETIISNFDEQMKIYAVRMYFVSGLTCLVVWIIFLVVKTFLKRNKEKSIYSVNDELGSNIDQIFSSIKEERHDFNNYIATIQSLAASGQLDELQNFTNEIVEETTMINDIININSPVLSALIQAKIQEAINRRITFEHLFIKMECIKVNGVKSMDLVKIVSNLIDNAFEAAEDLEESERYVLIEGYIEGEDICFSVYNKGNPISDVQVEKIFKKGFTTKKSSGKNSGLGLFIVQKSIKKYKGRVTVESNQDGNTFRVVLPL